MERHEMAYTQKITKAEEALNRGDLARARRLCLRAMRHSNRWWRKTLRVKWREPSETTRAPSGKAYLKARYLLMQIRDRLSFKPMLDASEKSEKFSASFE